MRKKSPEIDYNNLVFDDDVCTTTNVDFLNWLRIRGEKMLINKKVNQIRKDVYMVEIGNILKDKEV